MKLPNHSMRMMIKMHASGIQIFFSWNPIILIGLRIYKLETDDKILRLPFLVHKSERIISRVKSQTRRQNNKSRALKWDIVHLCNSNIMGDMIKNEESHCFTE